MRKVLIMAPPPTPNGDLHIGHLSGPYLRADIFSRYLKMRGIEAFYLTGADEHQSYVAYKAEQVGLSPAETANKFSKAMLETLQSARIEPDIFSRPSRSPYHDRLVQKFVEQLYAAGKLFAKDSPSLYCETCERYLFEAYVSGKCPHCGEGAGGNGCEACGRPNDCVDLREAVCNDCGQTPVVRTFKRLYFALSEYRQELKDYSRTVEMSAHMRVLYEQMLEAGLPDISMSHLSDWGIPVPVAGFEGQRLYVWLEMAPGLLAASEELSAQLGLGGGWQDFWKADESEVVIFCGFDNSYFYSMLFPALFMAFDPQIKLPVAYLVNEFYRLDGLKFSTSRNHVIGGREMLSRVSVDTVRFYLAYNGPEAEQTNFTMNEYEVTVQRELIEGWQVWLEELGRKIQTDYRGIAPEPADWTDEQRQFQESLKQLAEDVASAYEIKDFSPQRVTRLLIELVRRANHFGKTQDRLQQVSGRQGEAQTSIALELAAAKTLALLCAPIMPDFAEALWQDLGCETPLFKASWEEHAWLVPGGTRLGELRREYFSTVAISAAA
jgi:methionyl-tRNA synthetase